MKKKEDNIFDNPVKPDQEDDRPAEAEDNLTEEEKGSACPGKPHL